MDRRRQAAVSLAFSTTRVSSIMQIQLSECKGWFCRQNDTRHTSSSSSSSPAATLQACSKHRKSFGSGNIFVTNLRESWKSVSLSHKLELSLQFSRLCYDWAVGSSMHAPFLSSVRNRYLPVSGGDITNASWAKRALIMTAL